MTKQHSKISLEILEEHFKELRITLQKILFEAETFDEARLILRLKHEVEEDFAEKLRLAKDLDALDRLELNAKKTK